MRINIDGWSAARIVVAVFALMVLAGRLPFPGAKADDGWSDKRRDRWHATYNAALAGCLSKGMYDASGSPELYCPGLATRVADRTNGRLPR